MSKATAEGVRSLTVVGVGLLGGSTALAARRAGLRVVGVDRDAAALERAVRRGVLDAAAADLAEGVRDADVVVFCTPVDVIAAGALAAAPSCRPGAVLTDVGSTKAAIAAALRGRLPDGVAFVGGHPLAGSERQGVEYARADLFAGRVVVLTPDGDARPEAVAPKPWPACAPSGRGWARSSPSFLRRNTIGLWRGPVTCRTWRHRPSPAS
jgi:prephenate dehydrogenase